MGRSGYSEDCEYWDLIRWRGAVNSAIRGRRGQAFLCELRDVLDAMPNKRLIDEDLVTSCGDVCTLGAIGVARGIEDLDKIDPSEHEVLAARFDIAPALVKEIEFTNDDDFWASTETPENRWARMRIWVEKQLKPAEVAT